MGSREFLRSEHLVLRPWLAEDGAALARLAADGQVREATGLPAHPTPEEVSRALDDLAGEPEVFAVVAAEEPAAGPVGGVALRIGGLSGYDIAEDEGAIESWAGPELRAAGTLPEAVRALTSYAFRDLGLAAVRAEEGQEGRITSTQWEIANRADPTDETFVREQQAEAEDIEGSLERVSRIRSGGQTGADRGGLDAAREVGVPICGWCPAGGLAEDYPAPPGVLARYPELVETPTSSYVTRTAWNVRDAHATLVVAPAGLEPGSGTEMTVRFARAYGRPFLVVTGTSDLPKARLWLAGLGRGITLNVAGPRESKLPGTYATTRAVVVGLLAG